jgi:large subunit ribosomal protein L18
MERRPGTARAVRHRRIRAKVQGTAARPRLAVFRSLLHIYAQLIDDASGRTLVSASDMKLKVPAADANRKIAAAKAVGASLAEQAKAAGIGEAVFDRGGYRYHGRVKAVADGAREGGLVF